LPGQAKTFSLDSMLRFLITFLVLNLKVGGAFADDCLGWFEGNKIARDADCLLNCASAPVELATFTCNGRCNEFCNISTRANLLFALSDIYPGLTPAERALASQEPVKTVGAYHTSWEAEEICNTLYSINITNDESDACRHFVWAALLTDKYGPEFANRILSAHEQDPKQAESEKAMDLANNRQGILAAESLKKNNQNNPEKVLESFKENLKLRNLIVITARKIK